MNRETTHAAVRPSRRRRSLLAAFALASTTMAIQPLASTGPGALAASPASSDILADFEGGAPSGFFAFAGGSTVTTTTQAVGDADPLARPAQVGGNEILVADYNVFDFGGFGQEYASASDPQDWSGYTSFDFWFRGSGSGLTYQAEISDNRSNPNADTSERFDYEFTDTTTGWRYISIPFADFTRATDFQPGGAPNDGFTLTEIWAWAIVLPLGVDTVYFDDVGLGLKVVDDFESGAAPGASCVGIPLGFCTFQGADSSVAISTATTPPAPALPENGGEPNSVLQVDVDSTSFAGFIHGFHNATVDTWLPQDWSSYSGLRLWLYGNNSGASLFVDLLENRNAGSTTDDAERWTVTLLDDFAGWQLFELPFADFTRKEIGNGAPNDGLALDEVHGWAFGTLGTGGPRTFYLDDVALYGVAEIPPLSVSFGAGRTDIAEGTTGNVVVKLNRPMDEGDPAQVSVDFTTESVTSIATEGREYTPTSGTLTFVNGGPSEQTFAIETLDDSKWEWDERIALRLSNPVDVAPGFLMQASAFIVSDDELDRYLVDDFEEGAYLWTADPELSFGAREIAAGDPAERPGQDAFENVLEVSTPLTTAEAVVNGTVCNSGNGVVPVTLLTTDEFDATAVDVATVLFGGASETHVDNKTGQPRRHLLDVDEDGDLDLVLHFRAAETGYDCGTELLTLTGETLGGQAFVANGAPAEVRRDFPIGEDWTRAEALSFWYYGSGSGDEITTVLKDNRAPDPGPSGWSLVWSDEFDDPAGTPPDPDTWNFEIGDVTPDGKNGWGNDELQYYTDDPANASMDGTGNLAITLQEADGSRECFYGTCEYTSARLTSWHKAEFAYGRIESRIKVPQGTGIWPAFWSLGNDFDEVLWPQTGEIDFMEFVGRLPNEIFGTIHGPGYAGGASFSGFYRDFDEPVYEDYHTFAIEWEPDLINWYVDDILYHTATPADVAPNEWVFNDPIFFLLNVAVGGNFGGTVGPDLVPPQSMLVDYVRVYQGPDTAERWEASFVDNFEGWQEVVIPFSSLTRSTDQPAGAPDDGLTLSEVWGYGFELPDGGTTVGSMLIDQARLVPLPPPTAITVTNLNNSGPGSLRQALEDIAIGGTVSFDPGLAGGTIALARPLVPPSSVVIDGSTAPGISLDGGGSDRVLIVDAGIDATVTDMTLTNGYGFQLAGCVLNNGTLTLEGLTVSGCVMATDAGDFWQGGGAIYTGTGGVTNLVDSTVADNSSGWSGGGLYGFFGSTTNITRSTISGNTATDVGGGIRMLGDANIVNSTISGNTSVAWHGGAAFHTDGVMTLLNTTVADNTAPGGTAGGLFVGTFTAAPATLRLHNSIVAGNTGSSCFAGFFGAGAVTLESLGHNVTSDASCNLTATGDQPNTAPVLGPLADNGGPTQTHALGAGSPAIDAADAAVCPATDQRGVSRPQGVGCDVGAFELE